ncbi:MAG: hypothetical protein M3N32_04695 [Actinomycetota bacterium]|nr:hypothetical protein [Actinomycetota bacterium]
MSADATGASDATPGVDGKAVSDPAKSQGGTAGSGVSAEANTGATGLDGPTRPRRRPRPHSHGLLCRMWTRRRL